MCWLMVLLLRSGSGIKASPASHGRLTQCIVDKRGGEVKPANPAEVVARVLLAEDRRQTLTL